MLLLLAIGFVAGVVTALSPCVLPVLPIVLAGGATGRRPLAIVAGIVVSFTVFTLFAAWLLDLLGLPDDLLRNLAIGLLFLVAVSLLVPQVAEWLARPLQFLTRRSGGDKGGGFLLGASLGLVFVPCAGPVLAAVTVIAARRDVGFDSVLLTLSYAAGAAVPMLAIAFAGARAARAFRANAVTVRRVSGVLVAAAALAIAFGLDRKLQTALPGYTESLQERFERSSAAQRELRELTGGRDPEAIGAATDELENYGPAPEFSGIVSWLNTEPLTLAGLRGRVVLIDFWTYSCINCLRTLPYIREWDERYREAGLTIVGVHSPEFAFERVESNVRENVRKLELEYPVALDNDFGDVGCVAQPVLAREVPDRPERPRPLLPLRRGRLRRDRGGDQDADRRQRTACLQACRREPERAGDAGELPRLRASRPQRRRSGRRGRVARLHLPTGARRERACVQRDLDRGGRAGGGGTERRASGSSTAPATSTSCSRERAPSRCSSTGSRNGSVRVRGDRLYTLVERPRIGDHLLELRFTPGVAAYAFTFG